LAGSSSAFFVKPRGEKILYSFKGEPKDGASPFGGLVAFNDALDG